MTIGDYQCLKPGDKFGWCRKDSRVVILGVFEVIERYEPCSVWMPDYKIFNPRYTEHDSAYSNLNWEKVNDTSCD